MTAVLYDPNQPPKNVVADGLDIADFMKGHSRSQTLTANLLRSVPKHVDILASSPDYVVFSVFDHEGETNLEAMRVVASLIGKELDPANEDEILRGPILVIHKE